MNINRILFSTDFSHASDAALPLATSLARDHDARLLIVHVQEPAPAYGGGEMYYGIPEPTSHQLREMLHQIVPADPDVCYEHHLITGIPSQALVEFAKEQDVDLIVMGTHGRSSLTRMLMGSVAESVVRRAPCPVLTLRPTAKQPAKM
jgi:nucleotide-binding universal stress UspA family protein